MSKFIKKFKKHSVLDFAQFYSKKGMCVIPLKPLSKVPAIKWQNYQTKRPTPGEIAEWFSGKAPFGIAIICGAVSQNLVVIDFDSEALYKKFKDRLANVDIDLYNKFLETWIAKTRKGYHVYFRVDVSSEEFSKKIGTEHFGERTIDIQSDGAYVVAPPSIVRAEDGSETEYYFLEGYSPVSIPVPARLTWEEWERIYNIIKDILKDQGEITQPQSQPSQQPVTEKTKQREQQKREPSIMYNGKLKVLADSAIIELKETYKEPWKPGNRHQLALFLSGWGAHAHIHPVSLAKAFMMLEEGTQNEEPEDRLSAIHYTYSKAFGNTEELKELERYIEELKAEGKIKGNVAKRSSEETEKIMGKIGVQGILENVVGKERTLEIIRKTEEILGSASPYADSVIILTDFDTGLGYVNDVKRLRIYRCKRDAENERINDTKLIWEGAITHLTVYNNPLGGITKYEITWESKTRQKPIIVSGNLEEIYDRLRIEGFLSNSRLGKDALNNVINASIIKGKAETKNDIDAPGFYLVEDKIINIKYDISEVSRAELKEALLFLNELANEWYNRYPDKFATVIKWGVIAPFVYARKQMGRQYQVPHLALYGARNTGKTTLAEIASIYLWETGGTERLFNGNQANTEARFGERVRRTTFPIVINEANDVFRYTNTGLINLLKSSVEEKIARGRFSKYGYEEIPALSPVIFTLNPQPPVDFEGLMLVPKTVLLIYFPEGERLPSERIAEFRNVVEPQLPKLSAIGQYVSKLMIMRGVEALKKDWKELSVELLTHAYTEVGLNPPEWLNTIYEQTSFEEIDRERKEGVRSKIKKYSIELYTRSVNKIVEVRYGDNEYPVEETMREIVETLLHRNLYPFIRQEGDRLYITRIILDEIKLDAVNLKDLADLLGWTYIKKKHFHDESGDSVLSVIEVDKEEFIRFLSG